MTTYFFLGTSAQIGDIALSVKGQRVELPAQLARDAILGGCDLVTEEQLLQAGIQPAEIDIRLVDALAISQSTRARLEAGREA